MAVTEGAPCAAAGECVCGCQYKDLHGLPLRVPVRIGPVFSSSQLQPMFDQTGMLQRGAVSLGARIGFVYSLFSPLPVLLIQLDKCCTAALQELWYKIVMLLNFQSSELSSLHLRGRRRNRVLVLTPSGCENLAKYCKMAVRIMKPFSEMQL